MFAAGLLLGCCCNAGLLLCGLFGLVLDLLAGCLFFGILRSCYVLSAWFGLCFRGLGMFADLCAFGFCCLIDLARLVFVFCCLLVLHAGALQCRVLVFVVLIVLLFCLF